MNYLSTKTTKYFFQSILIFVLFLSLAACGSGAKNDDNGIRSITISSSKNSPKVSEHFTLLATARYGNSTIARINTDISWSSSDSNIAIVSTTGEVTALNAGKVTFSASYQGIIGTYDMTITALPKVVSIEFIDAATEIEEGGIIALKATAIYDDNSNIQDNSLFSWESSNNEIALVNSNGIVTAIAAGEAIVTIKTNEIAKSIRLTINPIVTAITLDTEKLYIDLGQNTAPMIRVNATHSDGSATAVTSKVSWQFSETNDVNEIITSNESQRIVISSLGNVIASHTGKVIAKAFYNDIASTNQLEIIIEEPLQLFSLGDTSQTNELGWNHTK